MKKGKKTKKTNGATKILHWQPHGGPHCTGKHLHCHTHGHCAVCARLHISSVAFRMEWHCNFDTVWERSAAWQPTTVQAQLSGHRTAPETQTFTNCCCAASPHWTPRVGFWSLRRRTSQHGIDIAIYGRTQKTTPIGIMWPLGRAFAKIATCLTTCRSCHQTCAVTCSSDRMSRREHYSGGGGGPVPGAVCVCRAPPGAVTGERAEVNTIIQFMKCCVPGRKKHRACARKNCTFSL